jgi:BirA family transcriptional regulator, biotin operon repressor / biotin---[acetyl-CoA-carboxylase] ligase
LRLAADRTSPPTSPPTSQTPARYDGLSGDELAYRLGLPRVVVYDEISSTLDAAHALASAGAPAGTLVLANAQTAGRGRVGRSWTSTRGAGVWLTLIERPRDVRAVGVLSLRIGVALGAALDPLADTAISLKWPNDVYVGTRKLAGILVEARWRDALPEWVAIGVGINVHRPPNEPRAAGLRPGVARIAVLDAAIPVIRGAALRSGCLDASELSAFAARDLAVGRACSAPVGGIVRGIDADGALLVDTSSRTVAVRTGSLVLEEGQ